jgi:hypothetical protein
MSIGAENIEKTKCLKAGLEAVNLRLVAIELYFSNWNKFGLSCSRWNVWKVWAKLLWKLVGEPAELEVELSNLYDCQERY